MEMEGNVVLPPLRLRNLQVDHNGDFNYSRDVGLRVSEDGSSCVVIPSIPGNHFGRWDRLTVSEGVYVVDVVIGTSDVDDSEFLLEELVQRTIRAAELANHASSTVEEALAWIEYMFVD
jgi:hypothetical protein